MRIDRRGALAWLGLGAAAPAMAAEVSPLAAGDAKFLHGVASGDPLADRLVIWTRVTAEGAASIPVRWELSESPDFARPVASGVAEAAAQRDFTVKVDVGGLKPGREYWYRFLAGNRTGGATSPVGRARTLPVGPTADLVLAVVTCSLYPQGWFNAYHHIAGLDRLDAGVGEILQDRVFGLADPIAIPVLRKRLDVRPLAIDPLLRAGITMQIDDAHTDSSMTRCVRPRAWRQPSRRATSSTPYRTSTAETPAGSRSSRAA